MTEKLPKDGKLHRPVRSKNREEVREVCHNMEIKRDINNQINSDRTKELYSYFYAGLDPRRKDEMADAGMIHEDNNAMSNLPEKGYQQEYPRTGFYTSPYNDDITKD